jgi:Mrp family chromosome partitioning ATPase
MLGRGMSAAPALTFMQLAFALPASLWRGRRRRAVRSENDLVAALGPSLLGARPFQHEAVQALARQLLEHWCARGRSLVPVISSHAGEGRTSLAVELARSVAALGERTLLIDGDLRQPGVHTKMRLRNQHGLAELLEGGPVRLAPIERNLAVLAAGRVREDPLELLSRPRLRHFLEAAMRPFRLVIVDTPAASRGPDFEMFAALAGGALVVLRPGEDARALARLRRRLARCAARPLAALFRRA